LVFSFYSPSLYIYIYICSSILKRLLSSTLISSNPPILLPLYPVPRPPLAQLSSSNSLAPHISAHFSSSPHLISSSSFRLFPTLRSLLSFCLWASQSKAARSVLSTDLEQLYARCGQADLTLRFAQLILAWLVSLVLTYVSYSPIITLSFFFSSSRSAFRAWYSTPCWLLIGFFDVQNIQWSIATWSRRI
jgi:hypothetical protein